MKKAQKKISKKYPYRISEIQVNQAMLYGVRDELKAHFQSEISKLSSQVHRLGVLIEEQNARNSVVLDSLSGFVSRQDRFEDELQHFGRILSGIK